MLILENVKKEENQITANFRFDGDDTIGSVVYDIGNAKVTEATYGDIRPLEDGLYGFRYVGEVLKMMVENNKYPATFKFRWY